MKRHKRIRLDAGLYSQPGAICSVTVAVKARQPIFADALVASSAVDILHSQAERTGVPVYAFCVMPDHIHLVLGPSAGCDIMTFVGQFKNLVQRAAWSHGVKGAFWQTSFWDHFLRADEGLEQVVEYVFNNPVRRGLAGERSEYPFSGSLVFRMWRGSGGLQRSVMPEGFTEADTKGESIIKNGVAV
ncbi:MAG: transposase [Dehalococcoidia bacterium]|nr:transposase [Dehalococcoidia bacterium]